MVFQMPPAPDWKIRIGEPSNSDSEQLVYLVSQSSKHFPDLALEAGFKHKGKATGRKPPEGFRASMALRGANPLEKFLEIVILRGLGKCNPVFLFYLVAGVGQPICKIAVIGEHQEPLRVTIESPHMVQMTELRGEEIVDCGPAQLILLGAHVAPWLLEQHGSILAG